jgi:triacylglycerol lipase
MTTPSESLPMYFPGSPFNLNDAVLCSALVNAAYEMYSQWVTQGSPSNPASFSWQTPTNPIIPGAPSLTFVGPLWGVATMVDIHYPEPFAFVAYDKTGRTWLAVRGSETHADFWEDADVSQSAYDPIVPNFGLVHSGFLNIYTTAYSGWDYSVSALQQAISGALSKLSYAPTILYVTSHSLGAGLSTLAVPDISINLKFGGGKVPILHYTLASPRVGDPSFAYNYNFKVPVPTFRVFNTEDIVPYGPPPVLPESVYEHVGVPISFTAQYDTTDGNHQYQDCYFYALNNPNQPQGPVNQQLQSARAQIAIARRQYDLLKCGIERS